MGVRGFAKIAKAIHRDHVRVDQLHAPQTLPLKPRVLPGAASWWQVVVSGSCYRVHDPYHHATEDDSVQTVRGRRMVCACRGPCGISLSVREGIRCVDTATVVPIVRSAEGNQSRLADVVDCICSASMICQYEVSTFWL